MITPIELNIDRNEFLTSKIDGSKYTTFGNFGKHLILYGYDIRTYTIQFYSDFLPKCIETGETSDYKIKGYWNRWWPLLYEHRKLLGRYLCLERSKRRIILEGLYTKYIEVEYWRDKYSLSKSIEIVNWLISKKFYIRVHDSYYDEYWTDFGKNRYIESILNLNPNRIRMLHSIDGMMDRGQSAESAIYCLKKAMINKKPFEYTRRGLNNRGIFDENEITAILKDHYKDKPSIFRDPEIQRRNSLKKQQKYTPDEQRAFSVRCVEYWIRHGYTLEEAIIRISELQKNNTIENIQIRYNCSYYEAIDIQNDIYSKRAITFSKKPQDELNRIYKSQDSNSYEYCLRKCNYDINAAKRLHIELLKKRITPFGKASKESLRFFIPLYKRLRLCGINREDIYLGVSGSREYFIYDYDTTKIRFFDFTILSKKLIIEYDGSYWHSTENAIQNDIIKTSIALKFGFKLLRINSKNSFEINQNLIYKFIDENI